MGQIEIFSNSLLGRLVSNISFFLCLKSLIPVLQTFKYQGLTLVSLSMTSSHTPCFDNVGNM